MVPPSVFGRIEGSRDRQLLPQYPSQTHSTVAELLDDVTSERKADLIRRIFLLDEAQTILGIPRSNRHANDRMIWAYTPKGIFTVSSAYKVALATSSSTPTVGASNTTETKTFWRTFWSLGIPNKLKTFAWRACRDILPTKVNLRHMGVIEDATCEACRMPDDRDQWTPVLGKS